jgi:signal transduction histidine kinase/HD-like signal output (HDOD) protein
MSADLREKRVELILQQLEDLPTLPAVAVKVLELTGSDDSSASDVVSVIQNDPPLTARILQLVHRSDLGVRGEVTSVARAVVLLGFEALRSAVLAVSVFDTFARQKETPHSGFDRDEFWKHSVAVACCAALLAQNAQSAAASSGTGWQPVSSNPPSEHGLKTHATKLDASEAFVCGLLHDVGKIALDAVLPKSFGKVVEAADLLRGNIADVERQVIGLDHMVVGKRLAEKWQLPATIRDCIWLHGQLPSALPANVRNPRLVCLVTLADLLVREQHLGYSGNYVFSPPRQALIDAVGLTDQAVQSIMQQLVEYIEPRARALGLGETSAGELYQQALSRANKELGRVSGQLAAKNRKLATRAKFFDALSGFQAELRPDAPPQTVLRAIGQTTVGAVDVTSAAAFSLPPGANYAEVLLFDSAGDVFEATLVDCGTRPPKPPAGDGPVLAAGAELEWLLGAISPRLAGSNRYWVCLEADGVCIGGVVWGAQPGEAQRLSTQTQELVALAAGWALALRTSQIREEAKTLSEQLAEANRQLQTAQAEILRSRTMITVGEMAAGAAHEMNNPLAVISGRSQLLASQLTDPKHKAAAHLISEQSHRLSQIITELMDFARPTAAAPVETDLGELLARALHEAKAHAELPDRKVEVTVTDVPPVTVDPNQVCAALIEVICNALQATDKVVGGGVAIHAAYDPITKRVVLTVTDSGCGMDEVTQRRAFDPFFSSKPAGRRRGLGLPKALRWIESSGGSMRLESRLGQGTRVIVLLPAAAAERAATEQQKPAVRAKGVVG